MVRILEDTGELDTDYYRLKIYTHRRTLHSGVSFDKMSDIAKTEHLARLDGLSYGHYQGRKYEAEQLERFGGLSYGEYQAEVMTRGDPWAPKPCPICGCRFTPSRRRLACRASCIRELERRLRRDY